MSHYVGNTQPSDLAQTSNECLNIATFTGEQEFKHACSYKEGYELPDKHYEAWIILRAWK